MRILGIAEGSHDAAYAVVEDGAIIEAHHMERFVREKNYKWVMPAYLPTDYDVVVGHEVKERVNERRKLAGQTLLETNIKTDVEYNHYETHAWAGWATAPFEDCDILCVDAIGESESSAVFQVRDKVFTKTWEMQYPQSLGLIYSAVTHALGYKPMEEEYIVMGLAAYGEPRYNLSHLLDRNCHTGVSLETITSNYRKPDYADVAASVQKFYEDELLKLIETHCKHKNLILMGGCALNCVANSKIKNKNIWIMPNPGDAGSALGAAARHFGHKLIWKDPYLGTEAIKDHVINPRKVVEHLVQHSVAGICDGRAEFGPRALGNRSLLANPCLDIKDTVNEIKKRDKFRPFAPAILEEFAHKYFEGPMNEYMQFTATAKHDYKSVTHVDGTARVQVVRKDCKSVLRQILEEWYNHTEVPMLLNTSLNIKGEPICNEWSHALEFERKYNVKVF